MEKVRKYLKNLFFLYLIGLAVAINVKFLVNGRFGRTKVDFVPPKEECFEGGQDWKYCVYTTQSDLPDTLLYFFHGRDEDEHAWIDHSSYAALVQQYWQSKRARTPKVVSISFGSTWIISPQMSKPDSGLLERFKEEVFNHIEAQLGTPKRRFLVGASMGGLNVLNLGLNLPRYFSRVAALCPPIYNVSPFASYSELLGLMVRTGAKPRKLATAVGLGRYLLADDSEWARFSPLEVLRHSRAARFPLMYISTGIRDEFGAFEASEILAREAKNKGAKVYWRPTSGDHCAVDAPSLAKFLSI